MAAGYWRGGGHDEPSEQPDRPERIEQQSDRGRTYGDIDLDKISDEELLSYFGYDSWDDWAREQPDERLGDELLEPAERPAQDYTRPLPESYSLDVRSLEDLFTPREERPDAAPSRRDADSTGQPGETAEAEPSGDMSREVSPALVRWLTGHVEPRPTTDQRQAGGERLKDEQGVGSADTPAEAEQPEQTREWKTIAEEIGEEKSYHSYSAAKRDIASIQDTQLHHIVEQSQADPKRSGFSAERINTTDNIVRLPVEVHRDITADYNSNVPGLELESGICSTVSRGTISMSTVARPWTRRSASMKGETTMSNVDEARETFRSYVAESDRLVRDGDSDAANAITGKLEALVKQWSEHGQAVQFLSPLLADESRSVRFSAASCLLGAGHADVALPALEELASGPDDRPSLHAGALLRYWKRKNA